MVEMESEVVPLVPALDWAALSHRQVLGELVTAGWVPCGVGDWAVGLRSPDGSFVARVCPFDPAYAAFVELCRRCAGNPWLPTVKFSAGLEGGGSVVILEYVAGVDASVAESVAAQWQGEGGDAQFQEVARAAREIDASYRKSTPYWDGFDLNSAHVRRAVDGRLVLIDVFCMDGAALYGAILESVSAVHKRIPRDRMRYALEIPFIARESSAAEIRALRDAWGVYGI